jgi:hypothetical protein
MSVLETLMLYFSVPFFQVSNAHGCSLLGAKRIGLKRNVTYKENWIEEEFVPLNHKDRLFVTMCLFMFVRMWKVGRTQIKWSNIALIVWRQSLLGWRGLRASSHASQVPSPKSLELNPSNLNRWEHGRWDSRLHWGSIHVLRAGSSKKLDPTFDTSPVNMFPSNNQDLTLVTMSHISMVSWGSKVGIFLHVGTC